MAFKLYRYKATGVVASLPEHYSKHPVIASQIEEYNPDSEEYEEDKVVVENHELPAEQRVIKTATKKEDTSAVKDKDII